MQTEKVKVSDLIEYRFNAKVHPDWQIEQIKKSIEEYGYNDLITIDENNTIIEGHGRLYALQELGYDEIDVIRLTHLTEEQKKAYILVHNQLTMNTGFDIDLLNVELVSLKDDGIDLSDFGIIAPSFDDDEETEEKKKDESDDDDEEDEDVFATDKKYLLHWIDEKSLEKKYGFPILHPCSVKPEELMPFNYVLSDRGGNEHKGIHFYIDDYQFERIWQQPEKYIEKLTKYACCLTPDFSLYLDMPKAMMIWNTYRSRMIGQIMQRYGIEVIPTLSWGYEDTFEFCFEGLPKNRIVSISTVGVSNDDESLRVWKAGVDESIKRLKPKAIILYGNMIEHDFKGVEVVHIKSNTQERFRNL